MLHNGILPVAGGEQLRGGLVGNGLPARDSALGKCQRFLEA